MSTSEDSGKPGEVESFAATGIDNAIDLLEVVTAKMDKASVGSQAANLERHPEVRSACATFIPILLMSRSAEAIQGCV